ncbi:3,4-dihydroxyphenylacetaldehyde synthase 2-like [Belonocnema kinseyi]|uniref:3,4-dihydroxyphenylacetaldehyde synthase 2-like n=1 Tax=Belonocnema kinseyi TaxID=2817044 RepID=UPI00143CEF15|nr:3,4-dihydroxyphenylacetaldehyde synthase 2-like [Belonocnema kinseyi]
MDEQGFRDFGRAVIDYIINYNETLRHKKVLPDVAPGYLSRLIPNEAPDKGESWQDVLRDVERVIMPGMTHWHSPQFHAFYPAGSSYPSIVGEMLSAGIGCVGFSWISAPACTELEVVTMNWLGKLLDLPKEFLNCSEGPGGGVIQTSASETIFVVLLAARERTVRRLKNIYPDLDEALIRTKLVAYTSDQSNSSVEKSGLLGAMPMRLLPTDEKCCLRGETLLKAIEKDREAGLIPCYVVATLGTTGTCAFDNLDEIGPICNENKVWLHIDAAYAGAAFVCPEFRYLMSGVQYADSFDFNPHKWLLVNFDCSALWIKDANWLTDTFNVDRIYLAHDNQGSAPDYRHWQIQLSRRFRSMKLWFVLRLYGVEGLQKYIRYSVKLARLFEELVRSDDRFEVVTEAVMAICCFRMKGDNSFTKELFDRLTARRNIYVTAAFSQKLMVIRFVVCSEFSQEGDIHFAFNEICKEATEILPKKTLAVKIQICENRTPEEENEQIALQLNQKLKQKKVIKRLDNKV